MHRKGRGFSLQELVRNLKFAEVKDLCLYGRIPKISEQKEVSILKKVFAQKKLKEYEDIEGKPIYYRSRGGRYFKIVTPYSTNSTTETFKIFDGKFANSIGCILSSNLSFWFYQIFSDNHNWKQYELLNFTIPNLTDKNIKELENLYKEYLADIESNAQIQRSSGTSSYRVAEFKVYKIGRSKKIIDRIDDIICPLYGLTKEETEFIKNYEIEFRIDTTQENT